MNQILSIEDKSKSKKEKTKRTSSKGPIEINSILKFFSISILVFGIFMIGTGSYSMYKDSQSAIANTKPTIYIQETSEKEITLQIEHDKALSKVTYRWNNEEETEVSASGKKKIEEKIQKPTGTNTLNIYVIDVNGQESIYQESYTLESDISINIDVEGNNIKITAEGKNELSYMTYRWDEEEETKIDINSSQTEQKIEIPKGQHTLTVIVVDVNNTTETKEQEVKGVTKPKLEVTTDGSDNFIIKASDEQGLEKVQFIINENERYELKLDGRKELEYAYPFHEGENKLEVIVYNESGATETFKAIVKR